MLIDSHAHLDSYDDLDSVLTRARDEGIGTILAIGIGDGPETMHQALAIAKSHVGGPRIFASVGIHPQEAGKATGEALGDLARIARDPLCVAIGEIGLDYYHFDNPDIATQKAAFIAQLKIASEMRKPILIHCRTSELAKPEAKAKYGDADAWEDLLAILAEHWPAANGGIMHCFSGTPEQGVRSIEAGFYLSFAGNLTYPKSDGIRQAAMAAPADRILVETDAPFLAPIPYRGQRNEPALVTHTAGLLATLRGLTPEALAELTTANFHRLFPTTLDAPVR
ncbi:TatD family hydrolase [Granulicella sibirica]|nr:TatD family hydrolase [Granulicella sibirica]